MAKAYPNGYGAVYGEPPAAGIDTSEQQRRRFEAKTPARRVTKGAPTMMHKANHHSLKLWIFMNGQDYNPGFELPISKRQFPHWINFLDLLTARSNSVRPIQWVYTTDGVEVDSFVELENGGEYVAVHTLPFRPSKYSRKPKIDWNKKHVSIERKDPEKLDSMETMQIYLRQKQAEREYRAAAQPHRRARSLPSTKRKVSRRSTVVESRQPSRDRKSTADSASQQSAASAPTTAAGSEERTKTADRHKTAESMGERWLSDPEDDEWGDRTNTAYSTKSKVSRKKSSSSTRSRQQTAATANEIRQDTSDSAYFPDPTPISSPSINQNQTNY